jgi:uncharacterized metal-binding protein YceD (DUF177 family)
MPFIPDTSSGAPCSRMDTLLANRATTLLRLSDLNSRTPTSFEVTPDPAGRKALAKALAILGVKKARLIGTMTPQGSSDWTFHAKLGATIVQECAITLEPVTTRIDENVTRHYVADYEPEMGNELEMPEDDTIETLPAEIDLLDILAEALSLALPTFPRAPGANLGEAIYTAPGAAPMTNEDAKPFAGLGALRDQLTKDDE